MLALAFIDPSPESFAAALAAKGSDEYHLWSKPVGAKWLLSLPSTLLPSLFVRAGRNGAVLHRKGQPSIVSLFSILCCVLSALWGTGEPHAHLPLPLQNSPDSRSGSAAQEPHSMHSSPEFKFSLSSPYFSSICLLIYF